MRNHLNFLTTGKNGSDHFIVYMAKKRNLKTRKWDLMNLTQKKRNYLLPLLIKICSLCQHAFSVWFNWMNSGGHFFFISSSVVIYSLVIYFVRMVLIQVEGSVFFSFQCIV